MDLSGLKNLEYFEAKTAEELKKQLAQIDLPAYVLSVYHDGKNHVAWLKLTRKIVKIKQEKK